MDNNPNPQTEAIIKRKFVVNDFATTDEKGKIEGHAAVFNQRADIGGLFYETIERGAFDGCDFTDVPFLINHDKRKIPIARSRRNNGNSTMIISVDNVGLLISANLDIENNLEARSLHSAVKRGDVDGMSFEFRVKKQRWAGLDTKIPTRVIEKFEKVFEVSAVNDPAYSETDIYARGSLDSDRLTLESVRSKYELDNSTNLEAEKLKIQIMMEVTK